MRITRHYAFMLPIDPVAKRGSKIGLHCTVVRPFNLSHDYVHGDPFEVPSSRMRVELQAIVSQFDPIELISDKKDMFGRHKNVPAHTLKRNTALLLLHKRLVHKLREFEARFNSFEVSWQGDGYRPHVSSLEGREFLPGSRCTVDRLIVVQKTNGLLCLFSDLPFRKFEMRDLSESTSMIAMAK